MAPLGSIRSHQRHTLSFEHICTKSIRACLQLRAVALGRAVGSKLPGCQLRSVMRGRLECRRHRCKGRPKFNTSTAVWFWQCAASLSVRENRKRTATPPPHGAEHSEDRDQSLNLHTGSHGGSPTQGLVSVTGGHRVLDASLARTTRERTCVAMPHGGHVDHSLQPDVTHSSAATTHDGALRSPHGCVSLMGPLQTAPPPDAG